MQKKILKIHPDDNVLVALKNIDSGETLAYEGEDFAIRENIPAKHSTLR